MTDMSYIYNSPSTISSVVTVAMPSKRSPLLQSHQYYQAGFITLLKDIRKYIIYTFWSTCPEISKGTKQK